MDECRLFLLRVWQRQSKFRASLRAVGDEQSLLFADADALTQFLVHDAPAADPDAAFGAPTAAGAPAPRPPER